MRKIGFDLLEETLKESGDDAAERLAVFYVCLGLGFSGIYFQQPEFLRHDLERGTYEGGADPRRMSYVVGW